MVGILTAVIFGWVIGGSCIWKIYRGLDPTLWFTTAMVTLSGCVSYLLVQ